MQLDIKKTPFRVQLEVRRVKRELKGLFYEKGPEAEKTRRALRKELVNILEPYDNEYFYSSPSNSNSNL
jgi:hypothetical protein